MIGIRRVWVSVGLATVLCFTGNGVALADPVGYFACDVPMQGAVRCGSFMVRGKQTVKITLTKNGAIAPVGFCLDAESNGAELGDRRAIEHIGETSAVLWTNPDPGAVSVAVRANLAKIYQGTRQVEFVANAE